MHRPSSPNNQDAISKVVSRHAAVRMQQRAIPVRAVDAALTYGRQIQAKGVTFCVIGRKEVKRYAALGVDLSEIEGLQVLVSSDGAVVTAYRNRDLHAIRATSRRTRRRHQNH